jgi:glutamine kinase
MSEFRGILLGAGRPFKRRDLSAVEKPVDDDLVLSWILDAFRTCIQDKIQFVGGHLIDNIKARHPQLSFKENKDWRETKSCGSFFKADLDCDAGLIVSYTDIAYRSILIEDLAANESDVSVAVDSKWLSRYSLRSQDEIESKEKVCLSEGLISRLGGDLSADVASAEFLGVVKFSRNAGDFLRHLDAETKQKFKTKRLSELVEFLRLKGFSIGFCDVVGDWAELNDPRDLAQFILGTKAETLDRLRSLVTQSYILDQVMFTNQYWKDHRNDVLKKIRRKFDAGSVIIRSSAIAEDSFDTSNAGAFESVLNVNSDDAAQLEAAIVRVFESYPDGLELNQVLVQPMVKNLISSGVIFTRTLEQSAPYYIINYDDTSKTSDSITSGNSSEHKTFKISRNCLPKNKIPPVINNLLVAVAEIEHLLGLDNLDIEFAVTEESTVCILQVRPVVASGNISKKVDEKVFEALRTAKGWLKTLQRPNPFIVGERAAFGCMPDWNPAEIIGQRPNRLAYDIYNHQIMSEIWATQRFEYGYRDVRPCGLMKSFLGQPYVDIRASFNSFIPKSIPDSLSERLVNFYIDWLEQNPDSHDKVEFDVLPTCFSLNSASWKKRLVVKGGITDREFQVYWESLRHLTTNAISGVHNASLEIDLLAHRYEAINKSSMSDLHKALALLSDSRTYGTLAFSHLARDAFVSVSLLKSGVDTGCLSTEGLDSFLSSIRSVAHDFTEDAGKVKSGTLRRAEFYDKYGHLRPDTYNICSARYSSNPELFLDPSIKNYQSPEPQQNIERWEIEKVNFLQRIMDEGLASDTMTIESFMRKSIEQREYAKFVFTKNISGAIELLAQFGESVGLDRHKVSKIPLKFFIENADIKYADDFSERVSGAIQLSEEEARLCDKIELPSLIFSEDDFDFFSVPNCQGNFIGNHSVLSESVVVDASGQESKNLSGKIVLIESADPGYDWIFGASIGGLITKFGGANSHMAIRCAEFGIPAAIGVGEVKFNNYASAKTIDLNCKNQTIKVLN